MLAIPNEGLSLSVMEHNSNVQVCSDWIEGSVLFDREEISKSDVIDVLTEHNIYNEQSFASEFVGKLWIEMKRRQNYLGKHPSIAIEPKKLKPVDDWQSFPIQSYCLSIILDRLTSNPSIKKTYNIQGELFEKITSEALKALFPGWKASVAGWSSKHAKNLRSIVSEICSVLTLDNLMANRSDVRKSAKDGGVDVLMYYDFKDRRTGSPVFLIQCATGKNWDSKIDTPIIDRWRKYIDWTYIPKRGFAMIETLNDEDFKYAAGNHDGLFLDRTRLLYAYKKRGDWLPDALKKEIIDWCEPLVTALPRRG